MAHTKMHKSKRSHTTGGLIAKIKAKKKKNEEEKKKKEQQVKFNTLEYKVGRDGPLNPKPKPVGTAKPGETKFTLL